MKSVLRPWKPRAGEWNAAAATHLFRRTGFGASPELLQRSLEDGLEASLRTVFARDHHDPALERGIRALLPAGDEDSLRAWWMALILADDAPLRERVTLFWHDHFATSNDKVDDVRMMHRQNVALREGGLGDFRVLLHTMAKDPAMLVWLDGDLNRKGQANENFAREVMELFALGIGNYGEADVLEAARAFTGWGTKGRAFKDRRALHDAGTKEVLGQRGNFDGEAVLDVILAHPACPRHVARRLLQEFVTATPEEAWVDELAKLFVEREWNVRATLEVLFASELFHRREHRGNRIAGPVELLAATARVLGARVASTKAAAAAAEMGQALFRPPSVKGWDGGRSWIDAGTWVARHNALTELARAGRDEVEGVRLDLETVYGDLSDRPAVAERMLALFLPRGIDASRTKLLKQAVGEARDDLSAAALGTALVLTSPDYQLT